MTPVDESQTRWNRVAFGLALGVLAAYQQFKLPPTLPLLLERYHYHRTVAGGFMSIYAAAGLLLSVPVGRHLGRRGPKGLLLAAFALLLAGNALGLLVPASGVGMLGSRLLEGIGFSVVAVVGAVITTSNASPRHRPIAVALWATWIPAGQVTGTLVAIPAVSAGLWRPLWWASAAGTLALAAWAWRLFGRGGLAPRVPAPAPGAAPEPENPHRSGKGALLFLAAALFALWSSQYISYVTWLPQYLVEARGLTPAAAALAYLLPSVLVIASNLAGGTLLHAGVGLGRLMVGSIGVQAAVWFLAPLTQSPAQGVVSLVAYGIAAGITATCLFSLPGALLGAEASRGFGAIMAGRNLGILIGPLLLAQVVATVGGWGPVGPLFGAVSLADTLLAAYLAGRIRAMGRTG